MADPPPPRRILVIKLRYIGDVVLSTPLVEALKRSIPDATIDILVNEGTEGVLQNNPYLDRIWFVPRNGGWRHLLLVRALRERRYDLILDLSDGDRSAILGFLSGGRRRVGFNHEGRWRGKLYHQIASADRQKLHTVEYHRQVLGAIGCNAGRITPRLYPSERDRARASELLRKAGLGAAEPFFLLCLGARWPFKRWPVERFAELAKEIHRSFGYSLILVGGGKDKKGSDEIVLSCGPWAKSLAGETTMLETAAVAERAKFFIGNDAGPMHVAAAMETPVVALFGPTDPRVWGPVGERHRVLWKGIDCSPCWKGHSCVRGELNCMRQISVSEAFEAVRSLQAVEKLR
jgi:predicted lipopolysaccharide heptosyltransferase III